VICSGFPVIPGRQAQARQADGGGPSDDITQKGINREDAPGYGPMIAKTFFLAKIIHRIGTRSLRGKKGLRESLADNDTFFTLRATRGRGFA
jgi:hypothetical protein